MARSVYFITAMLAGLFSSCLKDSKIEPLPPATGELEFNFQAKVKNEDLVPGTKMFTNAAGDSFTVTKFNYYISNIQLTRDDGSVYAEPESYHLMEHVNGKTSFNITNIPAGTYTKIEFLIGVDSLGNASGAREGDLDPGRGMFWNWDQGYIFFKLEGAFNTINKPVTDDYAMHVGGFSGPYSCLQKCVFSLINPLQVKSEKRTSVFYNVQADEIFVRPMLIGFDYYYANTGTEKVFRDLSVNYKDMFVIDRIVN